MQKRKAIASGRRRLLGCHLSSESPFHGPKGAERVERLDQPAVGAGLFREEDVDLTVEQEHHGAFVEKTHANLLFHRNTRGDATHVADLEIEQHESWIHLFDRRDHVDAGPDPMDQMRPTEGGLDVVDKPIGVSGEKDVRHGAKTYTRERRAPVSGRSRLG